MDEFYKKIKKELESEPEPEFKTSDWMDMERKLSTRTSHKQRFVLPLWWIPILLLLGSQIWLFRQWHEAESKLNELQAGAPKQELNRSIQLFTDTVHHTRVNYLRDTLYLPGQTQSAAIPASPSLTSGNSYKMLRRPHPTQSIFDIPLASNFGNKRSDIRNSKVAFTNSISRITSASHSQWNDSKSSGNSNVSPVAYLPILATSYLQKSISIDPLRRYMHNTTPGLQKYKRKKPGLFSEFRPQGIFIEGGLGYQLARSTVFNYKNDISIRLGTAIKFSRVWEMWLDAAISSLSFESQMIGDELGIPPIDPPSTDLEFLLVEAKRPAINYSFGMLYTHQTGGRLRPQLGIGLNSTSVFAFDMVYEFQNPLNGEEWKLEQGAPARFDFADKVVFRTGIKYAVSPYIRTHLRASYMKNISSNTSPDLIILQAGLGYEF